MSTLQYGLTPKMKPLSVNRSGRIAVLDVGMTWLAAVAVFFSVIGAFYYIRIVKLMYFDEPLDASPIEADRSMRFMLSLNGLAVLILGLVPGWLFNLVTQTCCSTPLTAHLLR